MAKSSVDDDRQDEEHILDVDVTQEMESSFLEYAYSVIYSRALPDARDGLKPVQRRILFSMDEMGIRPDAGHVKCARVVGQVMGLLHPHGDGAIYDALVRHAQPWSMRLPLIDGHGNFGSLDAGPAAMRYTECRMASPAVAMTRGLDQDTVDFKPNYDGKESEPVGAAGRLPQPAGQRRHRDRGGHGDQHRPAQPDRGGRRAEAAARQARHRSRRTDAPHPRPGLPHRRQDRGPGRGPRRLRHRPRHLQDPGHHPHREGLGAADGHRRHRAALHGGPREDHRADQEGRRRQEDHRHRRRQGPDRPGQRHPPGDRGQERDQPRGPAGAAVQGHQARRHLRDQRGRARRGAAPHPLAEGDARGLSRAPARGDAAPLPVHARARPRSGCTWCAA